MSGNTADVFIDHADGDSRLALEIALEIQRSGYRTWCYGFDSGEDGMPGVWNAILQCEVVLPIISPHVRESPQRMSMDLVHAYEHRKRFIPLMLGMTHAELQRSVQLTEIRMVLGSATSIPIRTGGVARVVSKVVQGLAMVGLQPSAVDQPRVERIREALDIEGGGVIVRTTRLEEQPALPPPPAPAPSRSVLRSLIARFISTWSSEKYDIFISYRREHGHDAARAIRAQLLSQHRARAFLDVADLGAGLFDEALFKLIERTPNFVVVLTPGCLDRCDHRGDWFRREIVHAMTNGKTIVPVVMPGFKWPNTESITEDLRRLPAYQNIEYSPVYFEAMIDKLVRYLGR